MGCLPDHDFGFFIKRVLTRYAVDFNLPNDEVLPLQQYLHSRDVTTKLIEIFAKVMWFKVNVSAMVWREFVCHYSPDILASGHSYVRNVLYICQVVNEAIENVYERFICVIAAAASTAVTYFRNNGVQFFQYTSPILTTYFNNVLKIRFYQCGGWRGLSRYISRQDYLKWYPLRNTSEVVQVMGKFAEEIERYVKATPYFEEVEYMIPDNVKRDPLCYQLAKDLMKEYFPDCLEVAEIPKPPEIETAMENLEISQTASSEVPMETTDSGAGTSASGTDEVEASKEPDQASVPPGVN